MKTQILINKINLYDPFFRLYCEVKKPLRMVFTAGKDIKYEFWHTQCLRPKIQTN